MRMQVLTTENSRDWMEVLNRCAPYVFHHLPEYHAIAEEFKKKSARMFVLEADGHTIALPLLLRPLARPDESGERADWVDATSVYGYAGPLATPGISQRVVRHFQTLLEDHLRALRVVSVFSRMHPLLEQRHLVAGLGEYRPVSRTVSIDLTPPPDVQRAAFRKNHKEGINRLRRSGAKCIRVAFAGYAEVFKEIYYETMRRVDAAEHYFFPLEYFDRLAAALGPRLSLFVCQRNDRVMAAGIFIETCGIIDYHLGGTATEFLREAPMKLMVDKVRLLGAERGLKVLHLGGGTTSKPDDPLLHFKAGFSDRTHEFAVWRWILFPRAYADLCGEKERWIQANGQEIAVPDYFPAYRAPTRHVGGPSGEERGARPSPLPSSIAARPSPLAPLGGAP